MAKQPPPKKKKSPDSFLGWLGRQIGHVKKAVKADVTKPLAAPAAPRQPEPESKPTVVYRDGKVEEAEHPTQPGLKLRRTVIDEVIVDPDQRSK